VEPFLGVKELEDAGAGRWTRVRHSAELAIAKQASLGTVVSLWRGGADAPIALRLRHNTPRQPLTNQRTKQTLELSIALALGLALQLQIALALFEAAKHQFAESLLAKSQKLAPALARNLSKTRWDGVGLDIGEGDR
jgi:hypothetical protein